VLVPLTRTFVRLLPVIVALVVVLFISVLPVMAEEAVLLLASVDVEIFVFTKVLPVAVALFKVLPVSNEDVARLLVSVLFVMLQGVPPEAELLNVDPMTVHPERELPLLMREFVTVEESILEVLTVVFSRVEVETVLKVLVLVVNVEFPIVDVAMYELDTEEEVTGEENICELPVMVEPVKLFSPVI
jgi:hypothetical protein